MLAQLAYGRRLELEARDPVARSSSLAGLCLVLAGAQEITGREARASELRFPTEGKPHFAGAGPKFSVSHCEGCVVVADKRPLAVVGLSGVVVVDASAVTTAYTPSSGPCRVAWWVPLSS